LLSEEKPKFCYTIKMSYQVLARKWRPKSFKELIGQEHITKALTNALTQQRLHHAYLFTGTRGVGKTTVARILAKCLNCEAGISANPCDKCSACIEIDSGRFIDLIEVDAASRTKVEDTRELLDNVQYAPTKGRYKIYLIDEVHMLSGHSFNALLKTLEEPPSHVKFLLATTDPQKLPITVLSRCLQFNLKNVTAEKIAAHLVFILDQEQIKYETNALEQIANAANNSVRDALSILDQAIAYCGGTINNSDINTMLGTIEQKHIKKLLTALAKNDAVTVLNTVSELAEQTADFGNVLETLLLNLHDMALSQVAPEIIVNELTGLFTAEELQLYYQIALIGKRDLQLAPTPKSGFEMIMLRMLAFSPKDNANSKVEGASLANLAADWNQVLPQLKLSESTRSLAAQCTIGKVTNNQINLLLNAKHSSLLHEQHLERLKLAFSEYFQQPLSVSVSSEKEPGITPKEFADQQAAQKQDLANNAINQDQKLQSLAQQFNAKIIPTEIKHV
jgi:DNA polymerase-3 subunit gamma/tau